MPEQTPQPFVGMWLACRTIAVSAPANEREQQGETRGQVQKWRAIASWSARRRLQKRSPATLREVLQQETLELGRFLAYDFML
jgi:hypothetical protein